MTDLFDIGEERFTDLVNQKTEDFCKEFLLNDLGEIISEEFCQEWGFDLHLYDTIINRIYEYYRDAAEIEVLEDLAEAGSYA